MNRLMDLGTEKMLAAIENLPVIQAVKDQFDWDLMPAMTPQGMLCMPILCMQVPGTVDDYVLHLGTPGYDPHTDQGEVDAIVRKVAESVQGECFDRSTLSNGHKPGSSLWTPGG